MKRCSRCKALLPVEAFTVNRSSAGGLQSNCRECQRAYMREHYVANLDYYLRKARRSNKKRIVVLREFIATLKSVPCADCGGTFPPCAMDFDHAPGTVKLFNLCQAVRFTRRAILAEAAKCEIVCANCHRVRTLRRLLERP